VFKKLVISLLLMFTINVVTSFAQEIASVYPGQNALNISKGTNISVTFDQEMDASTINDSTFIVHSLRMGLQTGTYSYYSGTNTATFDPDNDFTVGEIVSVVLTTGIENTTGASLASPYGWSFTIEVDRGSGQFEKRMAYRVGNAPWAIFSSDLDSDGDMDLAIADGSSNWISVLLNNGDGTFAPRVDYSVGDPWAIFSSDLDGDGDMDLAVPNGRDDNVSVLMNNGDGTFAPRVNYAAGNSPLSIFSSDLNGDGNMDLVVGNERSDNVSVLMNNGDGTFAEKVDYGSGDTPYSVFSADLDGDGDMDLAVANEGIDNISVLKNNGDGTFATKVDYVVGDPWAIFSSDLDSDGNMDLAVANERTGNISVLLNNGNGTFAPRVDYAAGAGPRSVFSSDLDADGDMDLAVANIHPGNVSVLLNSGDGTFAARENYAAGGNTVTLFSSDLDSDGDMDLVTANWESDSIFILMNKDTFITVTSPNGGEEWWVNSTYDITWLSTGTSGALKLEYSIDNGFTGMEIIASTPDDGTYSWTIPDTPSDSCLVRVSDTDGDPFDISNAIFSISSPEMVVITPNGGENWKIDSIYNINWTSEGTSGAVKIEYSIDYGSNWIEIADSAEDEGSYLWTIPDTQSDGCLVRISDADGYPSDTSDALFTISPTSAVPTSELPKVYSISVNPVSIGNKLGVRYAVPVKASVKFSLYDVRGAKVKKIAEEKPAGYHSLEIDMKDIPKGVYFLKIEANGFTKTSKAVLM
jgi:hypothetical protein